MKVGAVVVGALAVLVIGYVAYMALVANPRAVRELHDDPDGARARKVMLITLPSGRTIPVNYLRDGETVYAGADGRWWRELRGKGATVQLLIRGETRTGHRSRDRRRSRASRRRVRSSATEGAEIRRHVG